ncbi:MAG: arginine--tRNA ligase [Candidatus Omnitrophota bacterium]
MRKREAEEIIIELLKQISSKFVPPEDLSKIPPIELELPKDSRYGDLTSSCALKLASFLKKNPREVALVFLEELNKIKNTSLLNDFIEDIRIEGPGFINFFFKKEYFYKLLKEILNKKSDFGKPKDIKKRKILIEFVSANPTGPLSVAHARQAAVGDALSNILEFLGHSVKREYYLNDEGNQINILGKSIEERFKELNNLTNAFPEDGYKGEYIYDIAKEIKNLKKPYVLQSEEKKNLDFFREFGVKVILNEIKKDLNDFGVSFDYWYSQKNLGKSGKIKKVLNDLKKKNFIYEEDGALWFRSTKFQDDKDRVVIKSDGSFTYLAPDIAYHEDKFKRGFNWLINLWGPDHHGYIPRMKSAVAALGKDPKDLSVIIVQLATIYRDGKPVSMSTRRAEYITLRQILDEVGKDAAKFFLLMRRTDSHLDFDLELAKKETQENPVYYIQYAHARIASILRSASKISFQKANFNLLITPEELNLIRTLSRFTKTALLCQGLLDSWPIISYLQDLARDFHKFYDIHRVLNQDNPELTKARLVLVNATKIVLGNGLRLLGVSTPESM